LRERGDGESSGKITITRIEAGATYRAKQGVRHLSARDTKSATEESRGREPEERRTAGRKSTQLTSQRGSRTITRNKSGRKAGSLKTREGFRGSLPPPEIEEDGTGEKILRDMQKNSGVEGRGRELRQTKITKTTSGT